LPTGGLLFRGKTELEWSLFTGNIQLDNISRLFVGNRLYWIGFPFFYDKIKRLYLEKIDRFKHKQGQKDFLYLIKA
jgi:hypothetical protein